MRYFVTGATGFIGGKLARSLRDAGHEVRALVRTPGKAAPLEQLGVELVKGDIRDEATIRPAMEGCDGVFHVAAWYKIGGDDAEAEAINVEGTRNVLTAMRDLEIPRGVYTSTVAVFSDTKGRIVDESYRHTGEMLTTYEKTKYQAHYDVALPMIEDGLPLTVVMPSVVYGPDDTSSIGVMFRDYLRKKLPALPGDSYFGWAHVDDIVDGHVAAMERGKAETYILAGPRHSFVEVFDLAASVTKISAPRIKASPSVLRAAAHVSDFIGGFVSLPSNFSAEAFRAVAGVTYTASSAKARRELRFDPRSLDEGLGDVLRHEMQALGLEVPS